jgi:hypothetical protein
MSKSINELVSEEALKQENHRPYHERFSHLGSFESGATFATNLVWERVVEALSNTENHNNEFYVADWLVKNREKIIGGKNE